MGTKLQYAINLLAAASQENKDNSFAALDRLEDWNERAYLRKFQRHLLMDKKIERHDMELIKKTMLMHEDVFHHQVRELHRLYSVQKRLMNEIKQIRFWGPMQNPELAHSPNNNTGLILQLQSTREQTNSCSGETSRGPKGFDLERPAEEPVPTGITARGEAQTGPSNDTCVDRSEESEVELTLSIGGSGSNNNGKKRRSNSNDKKGGDELGSSKSNTATSSNMSNKNTTPIEQQNKRPRWLFQGLSSK